MRETRKTVEFLILSLLSMVLILLEQRIDLFPKTSCTRVVSYAFHGSDQQLCHQVHHMKGNQCFCSWKMIVFRQNSAKWALCRCQKPVSFSPSAFAYLSCSPRATEHHLLVVHGCNDRRIDSFGSCSCFVGLWFGFGCFTWDVAPHRSSRSILFCGIGGLIAKWRHNNNCATKCWKW